MAGNVLFSNNVRNILLLASLQELSILDCVVVLEFVGIQPKIVIKRVPDFLSERESGEERAHTQSLIERNQESGSITCACVSPCGGSFEILMKTFLPQHAPDDVPSAESSNESKWVAAQRYYETMMEPDINQIRGNRELCDDMIQQLENTVVV
jgi:hypothetical protein